MTPAEFLSADIAEAAQELRARSEPFAFATIIRTAGSTAAKPGAKALVLANGTVAQGFLGGGCTLGAVRRATLTAIETGTPQLISVTPEDQMAEIGVAAGVQEDGITYARNGCPSRGTVDIFIEPCLPMPEIVVLGASPVADAVRALAPQFHWTVATEAPAPATGAKLRCFVIATQGQNDFAALKDALSSGRDHVAFVGSAKKYAALAEKLRQAGIAGDRIDAVSAPAGLHIGAVTPEEIALSILAELIQLRRVSTRRAADA